MKNYSIPVKVNLPDQIEIDLIRSDYFDISNVFRIAFEIGLAMFSGILGFLLAKFPWNSLEWLIMIILIVFIIFSLFFWIRYLTKSKQHQIQPNNKISEIPFDKFHFAVNIKIEQQGEADRGLQDLLGNVDFKWYQNKIKTKYTTLRVYNIDNFTLTNILNYLNTSNIIYCDEKIIK